MLGAEMSDVLKELENHHSEIMGRLMVAKDAVHKNQIIVSTLEIEQIKLSITIDRIKTNLK